MKTESISVTACISDTIEVPLAVTYRQRSFGQTMDCSEGECTFYVGSATNVVGFVALNSHAVYPISATELVYEEISTLEFFVNLQSILIVDRLAYADKNGNYRYFAPNSTNVLRLAEQNEIPDDVNESEFWGAFGGRWGRTQDRLDANFTAERPICLDQSTTEFRLCPSEEENPVFYLVLQMLKVEETDSALVNGASALISFLVDFFSNTNVAPHGPAVSTFYSRYEVRDNAPIWSKVVGNEEEFCENLRDIPGTFRLPVDTDTVPLLANTMGVACMFVFTIFNIVFFVIKTRMGPVRPVIEQVESGIYRKPGILVKESWCLSYFGVS